MELEKGKINLLIDGQFGSTGKGLLASYIGDNSFGLCVSNAGPNSGHTFYFDGKKCVVKQLPVTAVTNPEADIYLCSGSVINIQTLLNELKTYRIDPKRLYIHPTATIIEEKDLVFEQRRATTRISSTQNGVGAALARKINRSASVAKDFDSLAEYIKTLDVEKFLDSGGTAFMEVPQGYSLSLNSQFYPYCTSRNITVGSALNDIDLHPYYLGKIIVSIRTYPIRVGNLPYSYSGDFYPDSKETSWQLLGLDKEYTTNTNRVRRVATFSYKQYEDMLHKLRPDYLFLNFCNYLDEDSLKTMLDRLPEVTHLGFGTNKEDIVLRKDYGSFV